MGGTAKPSLRPMESVWAEAFLFVHPGIARRLECEILNTIDEVKRRNIAWQPRSKKISG